MTVNIPISFEYEGIQFEGYFTKPSGMGNSGSYFLLLYNYSYGQLVHYSTGWKWCPNVQNWFTEPYMEEYFISVVESRIII